jgi:enolase-phosphatase E1
MASVRAILTDIEGTTSSISFVKEVLFPYARRAMPDFVAARRDDPSARTWLHGVAHELGASLEQTDDATLVATLQRWIDEDRKHTALKALEGMIWETGFRERHFTAHLYPDAAQALRGWHARGLPLFVYSSGSVAAQQLLFGHSDAGDLTPLFSGWFDTQVGGKREEASYRTIAARIAEISEIRDRPAEHILFLSDVIEELDAARAAGLQTALLDRREDYPAPRTGEATGGHARVESFAQLELGA